jgi:hypothetical protein
MLAVETTIADSVMARAISDDLIVVCNLRQNCQIEPCAK